MAVKIRLKRMGKIRAPYYRIVVADSRTQGGVDRARHRLDEDRLLVIVSHEVDDAGTAHVGVCASERVLGDVLVFDAEQAVVAGHAQIGKELTPELLWRA